MWKMNMFKRNMAQLIEMSWPFWPLTLMNLELWFNCNLPLSIWEPSAILMGTLFFMHLVFMALSIKDPFDRNIESDCDWDVGRAGKRSERERERVQSANKYISISKCVPSRIKARTLGDFLSDFSPLEAVQASCVSLYLMCMNTQFRFIPLAMQHQDFWLIQTTQRRVRSLARQ